MRIYPFALVFSTVTLIRNTDSSRIRGSSVAETNLSLSGPSTNSSHDVNPVKRPSKRLHGTMTGEERAQSPLPGVDEEVIQRAAAALMVTLHNHDADAPNPLIDLVNKHLESIDMDAIKLHLKRLYEGHEVTPPVTSAGVLGYQQRYHQMITGSEHTRNEVITMVRKSVEAHQLKIAKDMEAKLEEWLSVEQHPNYVFTKLSIAGNGEVNCFASPNLGVLEKYIFQYNQRMHTEIRLVDTFIYGFGGDAKLAVMLSTVKLSPIYRFRAQDMQERLFETLIGRNLDIDDIAGCVGMLADTKRQLAYQYLETVTAYALAYDKAYEREVTDICDYLIGKLGIDDFVLRIGYAKFVSTSFTHKLEEELFRRWKTLGVLHIDFSPTTDDMKVLDLMIKRYITFCDGNVAFPRPVVLYNFFPH